MVNLVLHLSPNICIISVLYQNVRIMGIEEKLYKKIGSNIYPQGTPEGTKASIYRSKIGRVSRNRDNMNCIILRSNRKFRVKLVNSRQNYKIRGEFI